MSLGNTHPELTHAGDGPLVLPLSVPSKAEIPANAQALVDTLCTHVSAKEAYVYLYARTAIEEEAMNLLKDQVITTLEGTKEEILGAMVEMRSKPRKFTYQDGKLGVLYAKLDTLKAEIKAREKFNQSLPPAGTVDPETGEHIMPPKVEEQGVIPAVKLAAGGGR